MGVISQIASGDFGVKIGQHVREDVSRGRQMWRETFGLGTDKEAGGRQKPIEAPTRRRPVSGGSFGRGVVAEPAAIKRLIEALRSMAPGGWSDDRWEEAARNFVGIAYIAIHRIATQWQQAEFQVFKKTKKDKRNPKGRVPITEDDPAEGDRLVKPYDLVRLLERPNRQDYFGKYLYRICQQKYLTGTALTWMVPNALGCPMELYCIPTAIAIPQPAVNPDYPDGYYRVQPLYPYGPFSSYPTPSSAVGAPIPAQWMLRFQYPHPLLRYDGYSPLTGLDLEMDEFKMIGRSRHYKMRRSFNPSVVLDTTGMEGAQMLPPEEMERLRAELENIFFGPENAGGLLAPPPGCAMSEFGTNPKEMDYPNSWAQMVDFLLAGFGITKPAAGMIDNASYSTLFATLKQLYWLTLDPDLSDVAQELTHHLCPFFGDDLIIEIRGKPINDHDINLAKAGAMLNARSGTINQYNELLELPTIEEQWGDERLGTEPQQPGMPGMMPGAPPGLPAPDAEQQQIPENLGPIPPDQGQEQANPPELAADAAETNDERPTPGNLSAGSLGPRKALQQKTKGMKNVKRRIAHAKKTIPPAVSERMLGYDVKTLNPTAVGPVADVPSISDLFGKLGKALKNGKH